MKTFSPKPQDLTHNWYIVDASDVVLGRLASQIANVLRGKTKPTYAPHADSGDFVVVINASKFVTTGNKDSKNLYRHSGFPGGLRAASYSELRDKDPERVIKSAVKGMMPKNKLSAVQLKRLRVFPGEDYPYQAQKPVKLEIAKINQQAQ